MNLGYARGNKLNQQFDFLEAYELEEIFSDVDHNYEILQDPESDYQRLLNYTEPGDCLVIAFLEVISRDYQQLLEFLNELEDLELDLVVLTSLELTLNDWREVLSWVNRNDQLLHPRLIKLKLKQEKIKIKKRTLYLVEIQRLKNYIVMSCGNWLERVNYEPLLNKKECRLRRFIGSSKNLNE